MSSAITVVVRSIPSTSTTPVDDALEVRVRPRDEPQQQTPLPVIVCASSTSGIVSEVRADLVVPARPANRERDERHHAVAQCRGIDLRTERADHAARGGARAGPAPWRGRPGAGGRLRARPPAARSRTARESGRPRRPATSQPASSRRAQRVRTRRERRVPRRRDGPRALPRRQRPPGRALVLHRFRHDLCRLPGSRDGLPGPRGVRPRREQGRFRITGEVRAGTFVGEHVARHGDGVADLALKVPDVDRAVGHARESGARILAGPRDGADEHGAIRTATIATYGETVHTLVDRSAYGGPFLPGFRARGPLFAEKRHTTRGGTATPSTTAWGTSSWAGWTNGSGSTTGSWGSRNSRSSSAMTSRPSIRR